MRTVLIAIGVLAIAALMFLSAPRCDGEKDWMVGGVKVAGC